MSKISQSARLDIAELYQLGLRSLRAKMSRDIIIKGGAAVGKSPGMPSNPELDRKPEVVGELVKLVRGFRTE